MTEGLLRPTRLWSRTDVLSRPSPVPLAPGVYAWWMKEVPMGLDTAGCLTKDELTLLYVGISPKRPSATGTASAQNLRTRIRNHYRGNADSSTLRLTLGCLLGPDLGIRLYRVGGGKRMTFCEGEVVLSDWMAENAFVSWIESPEPWVVESDLITSVNLPLNLDRNLSSPSLEFVRATRRAAKETARRSPTRP